MSRQLDNWIPYFDNDRKPLLGRLTFYKLHTTDKVTVTNEAGTPIDNPIHTTNTGKTTQQVFLPNEDVTVLVEKFIGSGNMSDNEENQSAWSQQYTFDNLKNEVFIEVGDEVVSAGQASTMEQFRQLDISAVNYAVLRGYYELGDMPPVNYKLVTDATTADDGGSFIRVDSTHGWMLIPERVIDCRVFGVFPAPDDQTIVAYNSQLRLCMTYANKLGLDVYMPQVFDTTGYYFIEGAVHTLGQKLYIDEGVKIVAKPGTNSTLSVGEIEYFGNSLFRSGGLLGQLTVSCPTVHSSWASPNWEEWPGSVSTMILDSFHLDVRHFVIKNCVVEIQKNITGMDLVFQNCTITGNKVIVSSTVTMTNCGYVSDRQIGDSSTIVALTGNQLRVSNFSSANVYIQWKNIQGESNYGDLGEQTVTGMTLRANAIAENAVFENVALSGDAELHNVSGSVSVNGTGYSLNIVDCWLALNGSDVVLDKVQWRRGSFSNLTSSIQVLTQCELWDVEVNTALVTNGVAVARFERCTINQAVTGQGIVCKDCHINANVTTSDVEGSVNFNIDGCYFGQNGRHRVTSSRAGTQVVGTWTNNFSESVHPIVLDMTKLWANDASHSYTYTNNNGKFLPRYPKLTWIDNGWATPGAAWGYEQTLSNADPFKVILCSNGGPWDAIGDPIGMGVHGLEMDMPFFSIGACTAVFRLSVSFEGSMKYGDRAFTQSYAFVGECTDTISAPAFYQCTSFNDKLIGQPVRLPGWVNNSDWPTSCVATYERVK